MKGLKYEKTFKLLSLSICILLMGAFFVGCSKDSSEQISFLNYGENIDKETIKEFEKKYGIKVNVETFDDMETMYQKISKGGVKYDVILVSDALMPRMIKKGLIQELNKDNIPNISQMDKDYLNLQIDPGNKYSVPYMFGTVGLIYNKDVVKEKVDSWDILWDEKYKDKVFMFDTYRDTMGAALKKLGYSLNSKNPKEIEEAKELLIKQRETVNPIYGVDNGTTMIPAGESDINMIWSGEGLNLQDENPNLVYVVPKEGANFWIDSLCIPKNAENVEGAEKFINFVSDKESALRIADEIGYTTPNKEARLAQPDNVKNNPNAYMPKEIMDRCEIYEDFPMDVKKIYDNAWVNIKSDN
ncbi:spermidine/putrescine ABC transporter substrate-binding protein [Paraclostridium sp. AKS46]|nr:spermidine/putrescine ABC transporter substrate-binding protein [Paraclostridium sp. AKS46]